jgi:hypothetical protein
MLPHGGTFLLAGDPSGKIDPSIDPEVLDAIAVSLADWIVVIYHVDQLSLIEGPCPRGKV